MIIIPKELKALAKKLPKPIYIVGGYCRNYLFDPNAPVVTDLDLAGSVSFETLKEVLGEKNVLLVNPKVGTSLIYGKYEYTAFRAENYLKGGTHTPNEVSFDVCLEEDACRRDFTVNSIYYSILDDKFVDPTGGLEDVKKKTLRAVTDKTFCSDGLRLMRLARLSAELGYTIDSDTLQLAKDNIDNLRDISIERINAELNLILMADTKYGVKDAQYTGCKILEEIGALRYIIPELLEGKGFPQNPTYHKFDVLEHIFQVVRLIPPDFELRLAALLHDVAKPICQIQEGNMYNHAERGALLTKKILTRLKYPTNTVNKVTRLVAEHMFDLQGNTKESKMRRWCQKNHDLIPQLVRFFPADGAGTGNPYTGKERISATYKFLKDNKIPLSLSELEIKGDDLIKIGISGASIGKVLNELLLMCVDLKIKNQPEQLLRQANIIKESNRL